MVEKKNNSELTIGRHCFMKSPNFLLGSLEEAISYDANSLMIYLGAPQNTYRRSSKELKITEFTEKAKKHKINKKNVIVHASYLVNLANKIDQKKFKWGINFLKREIKLMESIGLKVLVIHPGFSLNLPIDEALDNIAFSINLILEEDTNVSIALETMSGKGTELGTNFDQLAYIISKVKRKKNLSICWDTCHLFSSGYDIKNKLEDVICEFDEKIGIGNLRVIHVNDSMFDIGSRKDRHENIGMGKIGLEAISKIVYHEKLVKAVKILETPRKENFEEEIRRLIAKREQG